MHNIWVRLNAVIFFALTVLLGLAILCALSSYLHKPLPLLKTLKLNELKSFRSHRGDDIALLFFDLDADLTSAFHWNIKQLFVFVVAEFETPLNPLNQVIIWDKIIQSPKEAVLKYKKELVKYALIDQGSNLRGNTVNLRLMWDHMPLTGRLYNDDKSSGSFKLPQNYTSDISSSNSRTSSGSRYSSSGSGSSSGSSSSSSRRKSKN